MMNSEKNHSLVEYRLIKQAIGLAETWQSAVEQETKAKERQDQKRYQVLANDPASKQVLIAIFDQVFRALSAKKITASFYQLLTTRGIPRFFSGFDVWLINLFLAFGVYVPKISLFFLKWKIRSDTSSSILAAKKLKSYSRRHEKPNLKINFNQLGELVLGEQEANLRLDSYTKLLAAPYVNYISIKLSNIFAEFQPLAFDHSLNLLIDRLSTLFKTAQAKAAKNQAAKFINLDMEEYHDLELTYEVFTRTLDQPAFKQLSAGIVLQAYLPDSYAFQQRLTAWAQKRVAAGGAVIKMRLVKGANLAQELVHSSILGLPSPILGTKRLVDANFKRMLEYALEPEHASSLNIGIASHNVFDLAYGAVLADYYQTKDYMEFEMLAGMADPLLRVLHQDYRLVVYAPFAAAKDFVNATGYLVRRLDENTAAENFLRHSFNLQLASKPWEYLKQQFKESHELKASLPVLKLRNQDRLSPAVEVLVEQGFFNAPDTDFHLAANRKFAAKIKDDFQTSDSKKRQDLPASVGGEDVVSDLFQDYYDCNQPPNSPLYRLYLLDLAQVKQALAIAKDDPSAWRKTSLDQRTATLYQAANLLEQARGYFIGLMAQLTGKVFNESDSEISEAIDFLRYYPPSLSKLAAEQQVEFKAKGVVLVIAPWNFPLAIPLGGVCAALAAGNTVLLKPAPEAAVIALFFARLMWQAGVPPAALQVINCQEGPVLDFLAQSTEIDHIIFTGSSQTARKIVQANYHVDYSAETGGKNSTIVTQMADLDLAVKNIVHSAFSNGGQKCSATSLLILEPEVYDNPGFKAKLVDATKSFKPGSAWDFSSCYGPLVQPPAGLLGDLLTDDDWLLKPQIDHHHKLILSPGIKWGVKKSDPIYRTELFAPVLAVMRASSLAAAIELANGTGYGLTAGLESLDPAEQALWQERILAGNLYINRSTVGAIGPAATVWRDKRLRFWSRD